MRKDEKTQMIEMLAEKLQKHPHFYLADISRLDAEKTSRLRRMCFNRNVKMLVVKNTLLRKAMEKFPNRGYQPLTEILNGSTSIFLSESMNEAAKVIKEFRKTSDRPVLKGAFVDETVYVGDNHLELLASLKSKNELIADVIALLQSPLKNVIGALQSGKNKLAGIVQTLSEKSE